MSCDPLCMSCDMSCDPLCMSCDMSCDPLCMSCDMSCDPLCMSCDRTCTYHFACHVTVTDEGDAISCQVHFACHHHPTLFQGVAGAKGHIGDAASQALEKSRALTAASCGGDSESLQGLDCPSGVPTGESRQDHPEPLPRVGCQAVLHRPQGCRHDSELLQRMEGERIAAWS